MHHRARGGAPHPLRPAGDGGAVDHPHQRDEHGEDGALADAVEQIGIQRAGEALANADRILLVVDDSDLNQEVTQNLLVVWNPEVIVDTALNGRIALQKIANNTYDLILMDIQMPEMDGYETTQMIRQDEDAAIRNMPILAMTARALEGDAEKCIQAGMDDYIAKPIIATKLYAKIAQLVQSHKTTPEPVEKPEAG